MAAEHIEQDKSAARILVYYGIGQDATPMISLTLSQFKAHMEELYNGTYNVVALPDVLSAYAKNAPLPENSVIITFDGSEKSVLTYAAPLLKKYKFPFTVFLAPERVRSNNPRYLNLKDIKHLHKMQLVNFGIHPENYDTYPHDDTHMRQTINNAVSFYRDLFGKQPDSFAFAHGLYSQSDLTLIKNYGFKVLMGEQSGVIYENKKGSVLPRFAMTENYADQNRFIMAVNAMPFPAIGMTPLSSIIPSNNPNIGFTSVADLDLKKLSCFAAGQSKPSLELLDDRIEIRLKRPITDTRFRVNCTLPVMNDDGSATTRWRWFGFLLNTEETL